MKTPVTIKVYKVRNMSTLRFVDFELHFQINIDLDHWPGIYWLKLMVRDHKDDWWEQELFKKFWRSMTPEYQREEDDPIPF